jgi:hypothetical protein
MALKSTDAPSTPAWCAVDKAGRPSFGTSVSLTLMQLSIHDWVDIYGGSGTKDIFFVINEGVSEVRTLENIVLLSGYHSVYNFHGYYLDSFVFC